MCHRPISRNITMLPELVIQPTYHVVDVGVHQKEVTFYDIMGEAQDHTAEVMTQLRELIRSQAELNDTMVRRKERQRLMEKQNYGLQKKMGSLYLVLMDHLDVQ